MPAPPPAFTYAASEADFAHVTNVILENRSITAAFKENGIKDIPSILKLTDLSVKNLTLPDPDPNVTETHCLKIGDIRLIKAFIHFVHYRNEINNPIGNDWTNVTVDEFDKFRVNLDYTRRFGTLSNLPPIDISSVDPTAPSATPSSSIPPHTASSPAPMFTLAEAKTALTHVFSKCH